jgi:hypothetical protein
MKWIGRSKLLRGRTISCGCFGREAAGKRRFHDLTGQVFGRLIVTNQWQRIRKKTHWLCQCSCGSPQKWIRRIDLLRGRTLSCGCLRREIWWASLSHGHTKQNQSSPTYHSWQAMWARTTNRNSHHAYRYVKRGIRVTQRWKSFENFLADMGERRPGTTLHRKNNNFGYSKKNSNGRHQPSRPEIDVQAS